MKEPALYLPLSRDELVAELELLRAKLHDIAGECAECNGTGIARAVFMQPGMAARSTAPCAGCYDIREVLSCDRHPYR